MEVNFKLNIKYLAHIADKSSFVFIPISREVFFFWELVTAQFESDLETVRSQVIIILHSSWHRIPICAVCDAVLKFTSIKGEFENSVTLKSVNLFTALIK